MKDQKRSRSMLAIFTAFIGIVLFSPGLIPAGDLEPSGPPGPTMKTLDEIPPTWSQKLSASQRFEIVLDGEAVLDKETGLVWEISPDTQKTTYDPNVICVIKNVGGRFGWRGPTTMELSSLLAPGNSPALPPGHPFINVQSSLYWTTVAGIDWGASKGFECFTAPGVPGRLFVDFDTGVLTCWSLVAPAPKPEGYTWCVRGR